MHVLNTCTVLQQTFLDVYKLDVWLTVHINSMWDKKPTRCHLVLYLFSLYKLAETC